MTTNLQVLAQAPLLPEVLDVYDRLVASVGASAFDKVAATAIRDVSAVDRLYLFDIQGPCTSRVFYAEYETAGPPTAEDLYLRQYLPVDPILQATRIADNRNMVMLRTEPQDIATRGTSGRCRQQGSWNEYRSCGEVRNNVFVSTSRVGLD